MPHMIDQWALAAVWMRAVANSCGYTPETAKPLGLAYALARRFPTRYEKERLEGGLAFAGLKFLEPREGQIVVNGESYRACNYDRRVVPEFAKPHQHHTLLYVAADSAELFPIETADQTNLTWCRFVEMLGTRHSATINFAKTLFEEIHP